MWGRERVSGIGGEPPESPSGLELGGARAGPHIKDQPIARGSRLETGTL